jgi:bacteriocin biosynthesis cyclodehydratase domain-containing protein
MSRITVMGVGPFGMAVAQLLAAKDFDRGLVDTVDDFLAWQPSAADVLVVSLSGPVPALCRMVDDLAREHGFGWLPAVADYGTFRVGPLFRPHEAGCFECYHGESRKHDDAHGLHDRDSGFGSEGLPSRHARLAAELVDQALNGDVKGSGGGSGSGGSGSEVIAADLAGRKISRRQVTPFISCGRCVSVSQRSSSGSSGA